MICRTRHRPLSVSPHHRPRELFRLCANGEGQDQRDKSRTRPAISRASTVLVDDIWLGGLDLSAFGEPGQDFCLGCDPAQVRYAEQ